MFDDKTKSQALESILASSPFDRSEFDQQLLRYLVEETSNGNAPKETTIAIALFNKTADFNPASDSIVRSHIYALRKKLNTYYLTEGSDDPVRLVIPKGKYEVEFIDPREDPEDRKPLPALKGVSILVLIFALSALVVAVFFYIKNKELHNRLFHNVAIEKNDAVLGDFLNSDLPLIIAFGDYYLYYESQSPTGGLRKIRDGGINSDADLENFRRENPSAPVSDTEDAIRLLNPQVPFTFNSLAATLRAYGKDYEIKFGSTLTQDDIDNYNIIYLGSLKMLGKLKPLIDKSYITFELYPHRLSLKKDSSAFEYTRLNLPDKNQYRRDFTLITKTAGANDNLILLVTSFAGWFNDDVFQSIMSGTFADDIKTWNNTTDEPGFPKQFQVLFETQTFEGSAKATLHHFIPVVDSLNSD